MVLSPWCVLLSATAAALAGSGANSTLDCPPLRLIILVNAAHIFRWCDVSAHKALWARLPPRLVSLSFKHQQCLSSYQITQEFMLVTPQF